MNNTDYFGWLKQGVKSGSGVRLPFISNNLADARFAVKTHAFIVHEQVKVPYCPAQAANKSNSMRPYSTTGVLTARPPTVEVLIFMAPTPSKNAINGTNDQ